jgi:hypothetical protein
MSIDPYVATTDQPYVFTNDDPLNSTDPLGLSLLSKLKKLGIGVLHVGGAVLLVFDGDAADAAKFAHKTFGICASGSAGWGAGASATGCVGFTANGRSFATLTGGVGGSSPQVSLGLSFMVSNASNAKQLGRLFTYAGGAVGEGPSVGVEGSIGKSKDNESRREFWRVNPLRGCLHVKIKPLLTRAA